MLQWPLDKLTLMNSALVQTGDNLVAVLDDGSDEYNTCSAAYERGLAFALEDHGWVHATKVVRNIQPAANVPADDQFNLAYHIPADCLHLIWVRLNDLPAIYSILAGQLIVQTVARTGPVDIKYVSTDNSDPENGTPTFVLALQAFVMAGIYRGLHEDLGEAAKAEQMAMAILQRAKTRSDQQKPRTSMYNSRMRMSRKIRRPWPMPSTNWSGTGQPGS